MHLKERIERHPVAYLLAVTVSISTIVFGVAEYFCRERIEIMTQKSTLEINTLQTELTSIKRGLGDTKYLDIRSFVYPKNRSQSLPINAKSKYFASEDFYAMTDIAGWNYERTTPGEFGEKTYSVKLPPALRTFLHNIPMHVWKASDNTAVRATLEGDEHYTEVGPMITLQKTPLADVFKVTEHLSELYEEQTGEKLEPTSEDIKTVRGELERIFRGDAAVMHLTYMLYAHMGDMLYASQQVNTQVLELQKVGNVVYVQLLTTLHNATVNDKRVPVFFVREEAIIITDQNASTIIHVIVPTADPAPRGVVYTRIQEWFSGLAVPVS